MLRYVLTVVCLFYNLYIARLRLILPLRGRPVFFFFRIGIRKNTKIKKNKKTVIEIRNRANQRVSC